MLIRAIKKRLAMARDERGFTLVELLVVIAAGSVVMLALFVMLDVTLHQTSRTFSKVNATQQAQGMVENLENELHSACVAKDVTPVQGGANGSQQSDANNLVFVTYYGTAANPTPVEHKVTFTAPTGSTPGTLTEYTYSVNGGTAPDWTFSSTPNAPTGGKLLLRNVSNAVQGATTVPVFQYFAYEPYTDVNGVTDEMLMDGSRTVPGTTSLPNPDPLSTTAGLSPDDAAQAAEVLINLNVGADALQGEAGGGLNTKVETDTITDSIVFRFTPAPDEAGSTGPFKPCS
jgi:prepilin-type N-terminal cleavage/methylation domain-containing protein